MEYLEFYSAEGFAITYTWCEKLLAYVHHIYRNGVGIASSRDYQSAYDFMVASGSRGW